MEERADVPVKTRESVRRRRWPTLTPKIKYKAVRGCWRLVAYILLRVFSLVFYLADLGDRGE